MQSDVYESTTRESLLDVVQDRLQKTGKVGAWRSTYVHKHTLRLDYFAFHWVHELQQQTSKNWSDLTKSAEQAYNQAHLCSAFLSQGAVCRYP